MKLSQVEYQVSLLFHGEIGARSCSRRLIVLGSHVGKNWKLKKTATVRAQKAKSLRNSWAKRSAERAKLDAVKSLERQMKADKQAEKDVSHMD